MKVILSGTLSGGFKIKAIITDANEEVENALAADLIASHLSYGVLAESIDVQHPSSLDKKAKSDESGKHFVVYGKGMGNGFGVYGPFADSDIAEKFAERNRSEDDEWEILEAEAEAESVANQPTMILRKITIVIRGDTEEDVDEAFEEAVVRLKNGDTSGSDRNESSGFWFENTSDVDTGDIPA